MDQEVIDKLTKAGLDVTLTQRFPSIPIRLMEDKKTPMPLYEEVFVMQGKDLSVDVRLKPISALFTGNRAPPSFAGVPPEEYLLFLQTIEMVAINYFLACGPERDEEFARLYNQLRRRPDGTDKNPLFSYLQAAARLYMSLNDISQAEFEAVVNKLCRSAKRHMENAASKNYITFLSRMMVQEVYE